MNHRARMESSGVQTDCAERGMAPNTQILGWVWSGRPDSNRRRPAWEAGIFSRLTVMSGTSNITPNTCIVVWGCYFPRVPSRTFQLRLSHAAAIPQLDFVETTVG